MVDREPGPGSADVTRGGTSDEAGGVSGKVGQFEEQGRAITQSRLENACRTGTPD